VDILTRFANGLQITLLGCDLNLGVVKNHPSYATQKGFALPVKMRHTICMNSTVLEPKKLRPEIIERIENMDDESLLVLHRILLLVEKERLWRELSIEAEHDRTSGKFDRLPEIIREARAELRRG
jgi:hypothetical protein